jgi:hypothetical protein
MMLHDLCKIEPGWLRKLISVQFVSLLRMIRWFQPHSSGVPFRVESQFPGSCAAIPAGTLWLTERKIYRTKNAARAAAASRTISVTSIRLCHTQSDTRFICTLVY